MVPSFVHLVDDAGVGGVNRMLDLIASSADFARFGVHRILRVKRGALALPRFEADIIVSHLSLSWANMPMLTALRGAHREATLIHVEHSYSERFATLKVTNSERFAALLRSGYSLFDRVVAVSPEQGRWLSRRGHVRDERLAVVTPAVDLTAFRAVADRRRGDVLRVGAIGRLDQQKGFDILIDALLLVPDADIELHVWGDGPEKDDLIRRAKGDPRIIFRGLTSDVARAMASCDAIAMPSRWEPYGLVALEAFAAGRPLIASRADGLTSHADLAGLAVGDGSQFGWADMLARLPTLEIGGRIAAGRRHAADAEARFAAAWANVVAGVRETTGTFRRAA